MDLNEAFGDSEYVWTTAENECNTNSDTMAELITPLVQAIHEDDERMIERSLTMLHSHFKQIFRDEVESREPEVEAPEYELEDRQSPSELMYEIMAIQHKAWGRRADEDV